MLTRSPKTNKTVREAWHQSDNNTATASISAQYLPTTHTHEVASAIASAATPGTGAAVVVIFVTDPLSFLSLVLLLFLGRRFDVAGVAGATAATGAAAAGVSLVVAVDVVVVVVVVYHDRIRISAFVFGLCGNLMNVNFLIGKKHNVQQSISSPAT